jgi:hypothetical protein
MSVTYGGIDLTPSPFALAEVDRWWHVHRINEFDHPAYLQGGLHHLPLPASPRREPPRIGVLHWPNGASRWATCHLLATGEQLTRLQSLSGPQSLVFSDGTNSVTASMFRLVARPVSQRDDQNSLHLITLVDERYYWWRGSPSSLDTTAWGTLLNSLFDALSVTPTVETVSSNYSTPNASQWAFTDQPIPLAIDAACRQVGRRVIRTLSGAVAVIGFTSAATAEDTQWSNHRTECLAGGRMGNAEVGRMVPASVKVSFPGGSTPAETRTLAGLALSPFSTATGQADQVGIWVADSKGSGLSESDVDNYADQAAADFYLWQLSTVDATFRGVRNWSHTGLEDCVEWVHTDREVFTRVLRTPIADANVWGGRATAPGSGIFGQDQSTPGGFMVWHDDTGQWAGEAQGVTYRVINNQTSISNPSKGPAYHFLMTVPGSPIPNFTSSSMHTHYLGLTLSDFGRSAGLVFPEVGASDREMAFTMSGKGFNLYQNGVYFLNGNMIATRELFIMIDGSTTVFGDLRTYPEPGGSGDAIRKHLGIRNWMRHYSSLGVAGLTGTLKAGATVTEGIITALGTLTSSYSVTNVSTDRSYDANATTVDEIADVLGTLIADLQAKSILG